jgi:hypothetical protein
MFHSRVPSSRLEDWHDQTPLRIAPRDCGGIVSGGLLGFSDLVNGPVHRPEARKPEGGFLTFQSYALVVLKEASAPCGPPLSSSPQW